MVFTTVFVVPEYERDNGSYSSRNLHEIIMIIIFIIPLEKLIDPLDFSQFDIVVFGTGIFEIFVDTDRGGVGTGAVVARLPPMESLKEKLGHEGDALFVVWDVGNAA